MNISGEIHVHKTETPIAELPVLEEVSGDEKLKVYDNGVAKSVTVDTLLASARAGQGLTEEIKTALLTIAQKVAYIDEHGQSYYDALYAALYPPAVLTRISAVFVQGIATVYDTDSLESLRPYLTVTAFYDNGATQEVTNYLLFGTLTEGISTVSVIYNGKTATFNVTVISRTAEVTGYDVVGAPTITIDYKMTTSDGNFIKTPFDFNNNGKSWELRGKIYCDATNQPFGNNLFYDIANFVDNNNVSTRGLLVELNMAQDTRFRYRFNMFVSAGDSSWDIVNPSSTSSTGSFSIEGLFGSDVYFKCGWNGSFYYAAASADGVTWDTQYFHEWPSDTNIMVGYPIAFGNKRNLPWGYCIYADSLELDIDGALYWKAVE